MLLLLFEDQKNNGWSQIYCSNCDYVEEEYNDNIGHFFNLLQHNVASTQSWMSSAELLCNRQCPECSKSLTHQIDYTKEPQLLIMEYPDTNIKTSHRIKIKVANKTCVLTLKGIVYYGDNHFTSRIVTSNGSVWFNDGITTGRNSIEEGQLSMMSDQELRKCRDKNLLLVVYG